MGNAAQGLPFRLADKQDLVMPGAVCELLRAVRTDKDEQPVSIFKYARPARQALATRHWHKLRTLKHPYVISYIDGVELDDSVMVVVEEVSPLKSYLKGRLNEGGITSEEVIWGFKCVCQAVAFLHSNCNFIHGFLGMHALFVSKSGDWKVGCFDMTCNPGLAEDEAFFVASEALLTNNYRSPERSTIKTLSSPFPVDVFSLGVVIQETFAQLGFELPSDLEQLVRRMTISDARRRPTLALVLKSPCFASDKMALLSTLDELLLKSASEATEALALFSTPESIAAVSTELCSFKLLPCINRILTTALEEFAQRDSREAARQAITAALALLALLGANNKLAETPFHRTCEAPLISLWGLSDRAVRSALLKTLPAIVPSVSAATVNTKIFDPLLNGFADNNLKMREDTLKSLVCLLDKLDEKQLQDKLVRCMSGLQSDAEPAIRTNATIFLGRIAPRLKDAVKAKVLCAAFAKAIKDPFVHCRVAGLKAALATLPLLVEADYAQLVCKLMPQVCGLLVDKSEETRRLALQFVDELTGFVRQKNAALAKAEEAAAAKAAKLKANRPPEQAAAEASSSSSGQQSQAAGGAEGKPDESWSSGWTSWAVESISKSLEQVTAIGPVANESHSAEIVVKKKAPEAPKPKPVPAAAASGWDEDEDMDLDAEEAPKAKAAPAKKPSVSKAASAKAAAGWGDELDDDEFDEPAPVKPAPALSRQTSSGSGKKATTVTAPVVSKAPSSGWDDEDDDWDADEPEPSPKTVKPVAPAKASAASVKTSSSGWGGGLVDDLDLDEAPVKSVPAKTPGGMTSAAAKKPVSAKVTVEKETPPKKSLKSLTDDAPAGDGKKAAKAKVAVKKLSVENESWDDF